MTNKQLKKQSIKIFDHKTSITLEEEFWEALRYILVKKEISLNKLMEEIDSTNTSYNLSGATRVYILNFFKNNQ